MFTTFAPVTPEVPVEQYCVFELFAGSRIDQPSYCDEAADVLLEGQPFCADHLQVAVQFLEWAERDADQQAQEWAEEQAAERDTEAWLSLR
jgi:hypothetical protein